MVSEDACVPVGGLCLMESTLRLRLCDEGRCEWAEDPGWMGGCGELMADGSSPRGLIVAFMGPLVLLV